METEELTYSKHGLSVRVVVGVVTGLMDMRRNRLMTEALAEEDKLKQAGQEDPDRYLLRVTSYPARIAATVRAEGFVQWPPSFEEFCALPGEFLELWGQLVYKLNAFWIYRDEPDPKGETGSESAAENSISA